MPTEISIAQFIEKHEIKFDCRQVEERPDGLMSENEQRHFRCRISMPRFTDRMGKNGTRFVTSVKSFGLYFSQGSAHTTEPILEDVLDCLASDATGYENAVSQTSLHQDRSGFSGSSFDNWASEYGYSTDSRAAEKIFKVVKRQAIQLKRVLGDEAYQELLFNTERL